MLVVGGDDVTRTTVLDSAQGLDGGGNWADI